jgi:hypothetical protein
MLATQLNCKTSPPEPAGGWKTARMVLKKKGLRQSGAVSHQRLGRDILITVSKWRSAGRYRHHKSSQPFGQLGFIRLGMSESVGL